MSYWVLRPSRRNREAINDRDYLQARIQGRLSKWPSKHDWLALRPIKSCVHYLDSANSEAMGVWLETLTSVATAHELERHIRGQFLQATDDVLDWAPRRYADLIHWLRYLPYLERIYYLLQGGQVFIWMQEDADLTVISELDFKAQGIEQSIAAMVNAAANPSALKGRWLQQLHDLIVASDAPNARSVQSLIAGIEQCLDTEPYSPQVWVNHNFLIRHCHHTPGGAISIAAYLILLFSQLNQLRAELLGRLLFADSGGAA